MTDTRQGIDRYVGWLFLSRRGCLVFLLLFCGLAAAIAAFFILVLAPAVEDFYGAPSSFTGLQAVETAVVVSGGITIFFYLVYLVLSLVFHGTFVKKDSP